MPSSFCSLGVLLLSLTFLHPHALQATEPLQIAAAADLQPLLPPLLEDFQSRFGFPVTAAYASSATLATQIINGAPFAVFLSADTGFAQRVIDAKLATTTTPATYAQGTLVLWERRDGPVHPLTLDALHSPAVQSIAIADPDHAPYGRAAVAALTTLGILETVQPRLRVAENIGQAAQFVESGNAQLGFISLTSALTPRLVSEGSYVILPANACPPILQSAVILRRDATTQQHAQLFLTWLLSPPIQQQLARHGLKPAH